jgi:hypothetical protein
MNLALELLELIDTELVVAEEEVAALDTHLKQIDAALARRERRDQALRAMLKQELPELAKSEYGWVVAEYAEQKQAGLKNPVFYDILCKRYERIPVGIRQFIEDPDYLGQEIGADGIYPKIVDSLEPLFEGRYSEVVLAGSIGWGKTTFGTLAVAYDLYKVSCLKDPAKTYGMKTGSNITFVNVSVDKRQAEKVFFTDLYNLIKNSKYFNQEFCYDPKLKNEMRFPKNVRCYPVAASEQAALGVGVFCAFIDEVNFMEVVERSKRSVMGAKSIYDQAEAVFNKLSYRMRSRMNLFGRLPGYIYASSSARYPDDFTERLAKRCREEAEKGIHDMLFLSHALWETIPEGKISKETFRVEVGDENNSTRILTGAETDVNEANVLNVPIDFRRPFERDPELAVRDLGGRSTLAIKPFIGQRAKIRRMFELGKEAGMEHPFTQFTVTLQNEDPEVERLLADRVHWVLEPELNALGRPKMLNGQPVMRKVLFPELYHAHFDLAKTGDAAGLVIAHNVGARKVKRFNYESLHDVDELKPVIRVDLALQVVKPRGRSGEIDIPRMRAIIYQLRRTFGMTFGKVTFDTFGSQESCKTLHDEGFDSDILSVDTDTTPYDMLRTAIYDERVLCYEHPILKRELSQLERGDKKIDHPAAHGAPKDVADCLAAVVYQCEESWRAGESSKGLFQFGTVEGVSERSLEWQGSVDVINQKIADGKPLTDLEENELLFKELENL